MMKAYLAITLLFVSSSLLASSQEERAIELNEEMDFLMSVAAKPRVWSHGSLPPRSRRSGPAPSQMEGVEDIEERYFSDEVNFRAARAQSTKVEEEKEPTFQDVEDSYRVDGTVPKSN